MQTLYAAKCMQKFCIRGQPYITSASKIKEVSRSNNLFAYIKGGGSKTRVYFINVSIEENKKILLKSISIKLSCVAK